jgi:hypothetical protein
VLVLLEILDANIGFRTLAGRHLWRADGISRKRKIVAFYGDAWTTRERMANTRAHARNCTVAACPLQQNSPIGESVP